MNKLLLPFSIFLCFIFTPLRGISQTSSSLFTDTIIKEMALKDQLQQAPADIKVQFEQNPLGLPSEKNDAMLTQFSKAFDADVLVKDFHEAFQQGLEKPFIDEINNWLNDPSAVRVHKAQKEFYTLQGKRKRIVTMYEIDQNPPSEDRKELITSMVDLTDAAERSVESSVIIFKAVINALNTLSINQNFTQPQITNIVTNFRAQATSQAREQLTNQYLIEYQAIENSTLENYLAFYKTDAGKWLNKAISESMQTAYKHGAERFKEAVANL